MFTRTWRKDEDNNAVSYFEKQMILEFNPKVPKILKTGVLILTQTGEELSRVCQPNPVDGFIDYVLENWKKQGITTVPKEEK